MSGRRDDGRGNNVRSVPEADVVHETVNLRVLVINAVDAVL